MNAVEIEEAVGQLVEGAFDPAEFPYAFLEAFGNKAATIKRLRSPGKATTNKSDVAGDGIVAVLQRNNIHIATCERDGPDAVANLLSRLTGSPATVKHKAKFALATDGLTVHAARLNSDEAPLVCEYKNLDDHFGYFLELAGISTVRQIRENAFDIKATGRLNRLYVELLRNNPDWDGDQRREDLNHFFARLIFCFFAEDTGIFHGKDLFTETVRRMSEPHGGNAHFVLAEIFRAMDVPTKDRDSESLRSWARQFPYVNGGLFGGGTKEDPVPKFTQIARSYLLHIGSLDWTQINPDIFGSMIQAVADDEERGALGMHYTSVPNILKVLNPLFLDDLHAQLKEAGDNPRKLLNLRKRIARIRVFDPACGSGNFLVVAYKEMRKIEAEINILRGEPERATDIPLTNFRGIEIRHFAAEVARLALVIAEYQCDELYRGQRLALAEFLPLDNQNWITHGNALRLDWLKVCPPTGTTGMKLHEDDLFQTPLEQPEIDFDNEGGETFICGNPPFTGSRKQTTSQKADLQHVFSSVTKKWKNVDYVGAWLLKAARYNSVCNVGFAFVATNSLCQGQQIPITWDLVRKLGCQIRFAYTSFVWSNLAKNKAGVTVVVVGLDSRTDGPRRIFRDESVHVVPRINPYLTEHNIDAVQALRKPIFSSVVMDYGVYYSKSAGLMLSCDESRKLAEQGFPTRCLKRFLGSSEYINGRQRHCIWLDDSDLPAISSFSEVEKRLEWVRKDRLATDDKSVNKLAARPHQFRERKGDGSRKVFVPIVSSVNREFFPVGLADESIVPTNKACYIDDGPVWTISVISSRLHLAWIATVCGRLRTDYSYSNTLGWNTFPIPILSDQNEADLTRCAEDIVLAREAHWPATLAELYDPEKMPDSLRAAHDRNDETLERIYIGRRFKNDTERLETLFKMYTEMTEAEKKA